MLPTTASLGPWAGGGALPPAVAGAIHERLDALARRYDEAAQEVAALAAHSRASDTGEWAGPAARACGRRLAGHTRRLEALALDYQEVAAAIRAGAAGVASQLAAAERFSDLGALGGVVLDVLGGAGRWAPLGSPGEAAP